MERNKLDAEYNNVKRKKQRKIDSHEKTLRDALSSEMQDRIQKGKFDPDDLVIHYTSDTVIKKIKNALKEMDFYSMRNVVHVIRHSAATIILERDGVLRTVQEILGHSSITTAKIYTHIISRRKKKAIDALPY